MTKTVEAEVFHFEHQDRFTEITFRNFVNCDLFSQQHASALLFMRIQILRQKVLLTFVPGSFLFSPFPYIKQTQTNCCYTYATHLYK